MDALKELLGTVSSHCGSQGGNSRNAFTNNNLRLALLPEKTHVQITRDLRRRYQNHDHHDCEFHTALPPHRKIFVAYARIRGQTILLSCPASGPLLP